MDGKPNISLESIAKTLVRQQERQKKPNRNVTMKGFEIKLATRRRCDCQARVHKLIRNCLKCGRIVCEQEGSGPCFFCGTLVCTREERAFIEENSKRSVELYCKLMNRPILNSVGLGGADDGGAVTKAKMLRDKLLTADADTQKVNRVYDLESDFDVENIPYLSNEEKKAIMVRKNELKKIREREKRALRIDIDFEKGVVSETAQKPGIVNDADDPIIQSIIAQSKLGKPTKSVKYNKSTQLTPETFVLIYDKTKSLLSKEYLNMNKEKEDDLDETVLYGNERMLQAYVERKGYTMVLSQPIASLLVRGIKRHISWHEYVHLRGPLFIVSRTEKIPDEEFNKEIMKCRNHYKDKGIDEKLSLDYPLGAIVGRAILEDCLDVRFYKDAHPEGKCDKNAKFVLIFRLFAPLSSSVVHIPPTSDNFYCLDKHLRLAVLDLLNNEDWVIDNSSSPMYF